MSKVVDGMRERRQTFAGQCYRRDDEITSRTIPWQPAHGRTSQDRPDLKGNKSHGFGPMHL